MREDGLIRCAGRQVQTNLLFEFDDPDDEVDHQQTQRIELHSPPRRASWHCGAQRPQDPVGAGMQEQPHLIGVGRVARGAVSREVALE